MSRSTLVQPARRPARRSWRAGIATVAVVAVAATGALALGADAEVARPPASLPSATTGSTAGDALAPFVRAAADAHAVPDAEEPAVGDEPGAPIELPTVDLAVPEVTLPAPDLSIPPLTGDGLPGAPEVPPAEPPAAEPPAQPAPAMLAMTPWSLSIPADATSASFTLTNIGGEPADWQVDLGFASLWLQAAPWQGSLAPGESVEIVVTADRTFLEPGHHQGVVEVQSAAAFDQGLATVGVTVVVAAPMPELPLSA